MLWERLTLTQTQERWCVHIYSRCGKTGHTHAMLEKEKDQKTKRAGLKLDHRSTQQGPPRRSSRLREKGSGGALYAVQRSIELLHSQSCKIIKEGEEQKGHLHC